MSEPLSLYLHIPFCTHRCAYCDFNTYARQEAALPAYAEALRREIELVGNGVGARFRSQADRLVNTIFFGGGTPTLLSPGQFEAILRAVRASFAVSPTAEITTEANPGTVSLSDLRALRALGVNRISFGVQSANAEELRMLERAHDFIEVIQAVSYARRAGFDDLNIDLIYGLPGQDLETWQTTVQRSLGLQPDHISAYALTLEHGTPFGRWSKRGLLPLPDPDLAADMYEWASQALESAGYAQYEISNWARPGHACRHNLQFWRGQPYLGLGAGAHGYAGGYRYSNVLHIRSYIARLDQATDSNPPFPLSPAAVNHHRQTAEDEMSEYMLTGLRLTREGIAAGAFAQRFGRSLLDAYPNQIEELTRLGLLEWVQGPADGILRLTRRGRFLSNQAFVRFTD